MYISYETPSSSVQSNVSCPTTAGLSRQLVLKSFCSGSINFDGRFLIATRMSAWQTNLYSFSSSSERKSLDYQRQKYICERFCKKFLPKVLWRGKIKAFLCHLGPNLRVMKLFRLSVCFRFCCRHACFFLFVCFGCLNCQSLLSSLERLK